MIVLVLNCGSSSIKYQVIDINEQSNALLAKGLVDRIGLAEGSLTHKPTGKEKFEKHMPIADHTTGISLVLEALTDATHGVIANLAEVKAVGHRVAHGGEFFKSSVVVDEQAKENIRSLFEIAPLHNPANLEGILSIEKVLPGIPQVAVFDTSFHQTIPAINYLYALPYEYYDKYPTPRVALILGDLYKSMYKDSLAIKYYKEALDMDSRFLLLCMMNLKRRLNFLIILILNVSGA